MATQARKPQLLLNWSALYELNASNLRLRTPASGGVYELGWADTQGSCWRFYVGQAVDLCARLSQHRRLSDNLCVRKKVQSLRVYFRYALLPTQWQRDAAERGLYLRYRHECNDWASIPAVADVEIVEQ